MLVKWQYERVDMTVVKEHVKRFLLSDLKNEFGRLA